MDESLEREGYEHSNSLNKCHYHLTELDDRGRCDECLKELAVSQEWNEDGWEFYAGD